jgi:glutamate carboxypeptidase
LRGTGTAKILLLAHMDTVYPRGMLAKQPFRIEGTRAYGLGIADDKHGVALILHALSVLNALNVRDYGLLTVLINSDEEVSSPGSRSLITRLGSEHDLVLSCEGHGPGDEIRLTTAGSPDAPRMRARRPSRAATRSTNWRTRSCRRAICPTPPRA